MALEKTETLMLDMDGTLLDLAFDNYMWLEHIPRHFAVANEIPFEEAQADLMSRFKALHGKLEWYCLEHWCEHLEIDVIQLHHDMSHRVGYLPGAKGFLEEMHARDIRVLMVTNSHRITYEIKDAITGIGDFFDAIHSSHDYGHPKESQEFWSALQDDVDFDPSTTLFVDDATHVLQSARNYGIEMLVNITQPDTRHPAKEHDDFVGVEKIAELLG